MYLDHEGNRKGDISPSWALLSSVEHESPHRTIEAPCTPRSRGGGRTNAAFMPPRTIKILDVKTLEWNKNLQIVDEKCDTDFAIRKLFHHDTKM